MPEVGASPELKDEVERLKREAERETDMNERKKRKWEEENDPSTSDNKIAVSILCLYCSECYLLNGTVVLWRYWWGMLC